MDKNELRAIETKIRVYNAKMPIEGLRASLLHNAEKVIMHYKIQAKVATESNEEMGKEIISCLTEIKELKENSISEMAQRIQELSEENISLLAEIDHLEELLNPKI